VIAEAGFKVTIGEGLFAASSSEAASTREDGASETDPKSKRNATILEALNIACAYTTSALGDFNSGVKPAAGATLEAEIRME
jgi:hypothetical protein